MILLLCLKHRLSIVVISVIVVLIVLLVVIVVILARSTGALAGEIAAVLTRSARRLRHRLFDITIDIPTVGVDHLVSHEFGKRINIILYIFLSRRAERAPTHIH